MTTSKTNTTTSGFANKSKTSRIHHGPTSHKKDTQETLSVQQAILCLIVIFSIALMALYFVYTKFPKLEVSEREHIKLPRCMEDAQNLARVLSHYKDRYYVVVLTAVFVMYIFLQTFAIPGSIFLSIISGFLFPSWVALLLICFCSATGASFCYLLSYLAGRPIVSRYFPKRAQSWQEKVEKQKGNLLFYMIFLRITPFLPNWFINITSPVINVPLWPFFLGTFIGVAPPSLVAVQAGTTLYELISYQDAFSTTTVMLLAAAALLSLVPVLLKHKLRQKFD
ncbi:transmembrane protein 41B isoform X2 [Hyalella azteca]|nr:transmembrane protein 41B isoform X2 [Hyalella azteca]XP_018023954.1 transmembrane protein 41B isoform X2 [Hyalella azteca]XP_047738963.1 transmembrane protein 41B isoform X2 [Hyalella azteca]XP_047738964.1 transmembrane protein 41B isoform X2 [Hyalella azteca]